MPLVSFTNAYSVLFDGTNDYLDLGASDDIITSNVFSLSMWLKIGDTSGGAKRPFVSNGDGGVTNLRIVIETSGAVTAGYYNGSGLSSTAGGSAIDDGNWHHIVFTTTASAQALYIDGSSVATTSNTFSSRASSSVSTTVAAHVASGVYAAMNADEVATWAGTALSASDVTNIYNSGVPSDISSLNPTKWWRMGDGTDPVADGTGWNTNNKFVFDQIGTSIGSEMVISDAYDSDNWYVYSGNTMTFGDNFMRCERTASGNSNGWFTYLRSSAEANSILTSTPTTDSFYLLTFDVETDDTDAYVFVRINNTSSYYLQGTGNGTKTIVYKKDSNIDYLEGRNLSQGKYMKISNVSVKQINGATAELINGASIEEDVPS